MQTTHSYQSSGVGNLSFPQCSGWVAKEVAKWALFVTTHYGQFEIVLHVSSARNLTRTIAPSDAPSDPQSRYEIAPSALNRGDECVTSIQGDVLSLAGSTKMSPKPSRRIRPGADLAAIYLMVFLMLAQLRLITGLSGMDHGQHHSGRAGVAAQQTRLDRDSRARRDPGPPCDLASASATARWYSR